MKQSKLWAQIITENEQLQNKIQSGIESIGQDDGLMNDVGERFSEISVEDPLFIHKLNYIFFGERENTHSQRDKTHSQSTELEQGVEESKEDKKPIARKFLAKFTADEIKGLCRNRYSLLSMEDFLFHLNQLNAASSGNLLKDKK